jgi:hypothetical protein
LAAFAIGETHIDTSLKAACVELAQEMLQELGKYEQSKFHFLFTGDESWMFYT